MLRFIIIHWQTLLGIYVIGAVATFIATAIMLFRGLREGKDELDYMEYEHYEPSRADDVLAAIVMIVMSALIGVLWTGFPLILGAVFLLDWFKEKFPRHMGDMSDEDDEEEWQDGIDWKHDGGKDLEFPERERAE